jgi:hypothetical protein
VLLNENYNELLQNDITTVLLSLRSPQLGNYAQSNIMATIGPEYEHEFEPLCECNICYDETLKSENIVSLNCHHNFCVSCVRNIITTSRTQLKNPTCAYCRETIETITVQNKDTLNDVNNFILV